MRSNSLQIVRRPLRRRRRACVAKAKETGKFDYDAPIEGLQAIDRYTLRLKLNFADYELLAEPDDDRRSPRSRARWSRRTATAAAG